MHSIRMRQLTGQQAEYVIDIQLPVTVSLPGSMFIVIDVIRASG